MLDQNSFGNEQASLEQAKLIKYFDDFGKQMNSRRSNGAGLEQQLLSLSKAYNQAQEKLLQTERTLMNESILLEKQRSVLEIYKYVLTEEMDDQGILTFIQHLEEEQSTTEIFDQLQIIKTLINRKKVKGCKRQLEDDRAVRELRKELAKKYEEKQEFQQESQIISNENYELKTKLAQMEEELAECKNQLSQVKHSLAITSQKAESAENKNRSVSEELNEKTFRLEQYKNSEGKYKKLEQQLSDLKGFLKAKIDFQIKDKIEDKQNQQANRAQTVKKECEKPEDFRSFMKILQHRFSHLLKYRTQYKKMKQNVELTQFLKKETSLLKLFLSQQALKVFKEFQEKKMDCIETQIRNLAVLQKNNAIRLQECQRDVWRYKIMLLKDGQQSNMTNSAMFYSKEGTNFTIDTTNQRALITKINKESAVSANTAIPQDVSEFYA